MKMVYSKKYRQKLWLLHVVWATIVILLLATAYLLITIFLSNNFYNVLEKIFGYDLAHWMKSYEPAVLILVVMTAQFIVWAVVECWSSRKLMLIVDSMETVLDSSETTVSLPSGFEDLENQLNLLKSRSREQQHLLEIQAREKTDTLTYLAHDIRTPLASVVGYLSLLCEAPDLPEGQRQKYAHRALEKAVKFETLIDEFFDITRFTLEENVLNKRQVDLGFLLEQVADEFYPLLNKKKLHLELKLEEDLFIQADSEKIARVFNNVLKNAVLYSHPDTSILMAAEKSSNKIEVRVKNEGDTIPPDKIGHIFEKFYRTNVNGGPDDHGTGLGLAIAREIVRLHGGEISAESIGGATSFSICLPADIASEE